MTDAIGIDVHIDFVKASRGVRVRLSMFGVTGFTSSTIPIIVHATHENVYVPAQNAKNGVELLEPY